MSVLCVLFLLAAIFFYWQFKKWRAYAKAYRAWRNRNCNCQAPGDDPEPEEPPFP